MMTVAALIWIPFKFLWEHKRLAVACIVILAGVGAFTTWRGSQQPEITDAPAVYSENLPRELASLPVYATSTRYYYVVNAHESGNYIYLDDYYAFDNKWVRYNAEPLPLIKSQVKIYSR